VVAYKNLKTKEKTNLIIHNNSQRIKPKIDKKYSQSSHKQPPWEFRKVITTRAGRKQLCDETIEGGCL